MEFDSTIVQICKKILREAEKEIIALTEQFKAVAVIGLRQSATVR